MMNNVNIRRVIKLNECAERQNYPSLVVDVCTSVDQQTTHIYVAIVTGNVQRSETALLIASKKTAVQRSTAHDVNKTTHNRRSFSLA